MELTVIKQGNFKIAKNKKFKLLDPNDVSKGIKLAVQPFLITTLNDCILLDVGLDFLEDKQPAILKQLATHGVHPDNITKILISHFHKDHVGGLGYFNTENEWVANFPKATIYLNKQAFEHALEQKTNPSYDHEMLQQLQKMSAIFWIDTAEGWLTPEIGFLVTNAHDVFHQVFWITDKTTTFFYGADDLPTTAYLKRAIAYKTDYNGEKAMKLRKIWKEKAKAENWHILLYHDLKDPVVQF
ncbi:MBL fold metallo-hydrolase [Flavobacterium sp. CBA20B-1]|uniref:MBL fold metallo-hydrolase n=1 Tax=unclassified Flavobacterium TaxID=196869 RepID=UPI002224A0D2|nr:MULTISPECIES: MBL fold metallo-hydrolase [unclassified Flavobacterium]WCM43413.1 MBL fold metallo-hydrolase [Flavobacterium sp. CBA20B-1]